MKYSNFDDRNWTSEIVTYQSMKNKTAENNSFEYYSTDSDYFQYYDDDDYDVFTYEGFDFERPIYVYLWELLVILTTVFNVIVIVVFMRIGLRSATHVVLIAIAVSDSLTGLVTLPSYIYVYSQYEPGLETGRDAYVLRKDWCNAFMISKFFLSKWFHTASVWLTLLLGVQRYISVAIPLKAKIIFSSRKTLFCIIAIFVFSPFLHIYHLFHFKARSGMCQWDLNDSWGLVYLWIAVLLMHLIPCTLLVISTVMMIYCLFSAMSQFTSDDGMAQTSKQRRTDWNRRMSITVSTIVIIFLIPEIPYGIFQLYTVIRMHAGKSIMDLHTNRAFHAVYEILLLFSYHANFWVYTILNKIFRSELRKTFTGLLDSVCKVFGKRLGSTSVSSATQKPRQELVPLQNGNAKKDCLAE